jgi:hypothetical protein
MKRILAIIFLFVTGFNAISQLSINTAGSPVSIDFNTYTGAGFTPTPAAGQLSSLEWQVLGMSDGNLLFGGTQTGGDFARGLSNGGVTTGGAYSFNNGTGGSMGVQPTGADFNNGSFTLRIQNNTGAVMNQITLDYEIWVLNNETRASSFNFSHSADNLMFTPIAAVNFVSPEAADASPTWVMTPRATVISGLTINDGDFYYLRWSHADVSGSGGRDEFGLDNINVQLDFVVIPEITATPLLLSGFQQTLGAPSAEQTFEVSAVNLTDDLNLVVTGDYEISLSSGSGFTNALALTPTSGEILPTTIYVRLNGLAVASPSNGQVQLTSPGATTVNVNLEGEIIPAPVPEVNASVASLTGFVQIVGTPSTEQSFDVSGTALIDDVSIQVVSGDYEIATNAAGPYSNLITLPNSGGTLASTPIFVRLNGLAAAAPSNGSIDISSLDATTVTVLLEGEIVEAIDPEVNASVTSLTGFSQIVGTPSAEQSFEVSGNFLTDNVTVELTSGDYEIATSAAGPYSTLIDLTQVSGTVAVTQIFVRLNGVVVASPSNGSIEITSTGAQSVTVLLEGEILPVPDPEVFVSTNSLVGFEQIIGTPSAEQSFQVSGEFLTNDAVIQVVSGDYEIATNAAGPYVSSISLPNAGGSLASTSIFVRLNGLFAATPANGVIEVSSIGAVTEVIVLEGNIPNSIIIDFEGTGETKTSYALGNVTLSGYQFALDNVLIGTAAADFKNGIRSARLRAYDGAYMEMLQDKPNGLGEISFVYREYGTDPDQQPWNVEYSINGGIDWNLIGTVTANATVQTFQAIVEVEGDVRVRFVLATTPGITGNRRMNIDDIELTNYIPEPVVTAVPSVLNNFIQIIGAPSAEQSFTASGDFLLGDVTVNVVAGDYEIATSQLGPWSSSLLLSPINGEVASTTIFVRLNGTTPASPAPGLIQITSIGAATAEVELNGIISLTPLPQVFASVTDLTGFSQQLPGISAEQQFVVTGENLDDDIQLSVSGDFEISLTSGAGFSNSLLIPAVAGEVAPTTVYVRLNGSSAQTLVEEVITLTSLNSIFDPAVILEGEILPEPVPTINAAPLTLAFFSQTVGAPSAEQSFEVAGIDLTNDIELAVSGDFEISLTSGAGFGASIVLTETAGVISATTIYVRLNGSTPTALVEEVVSMTSAGANTVQIELEGEILAPIVPEVIVNTNLLDGFVQYVGTPSATESFIVSGVDLEQDVLVTVSGDYEISLDAATGYVTAISIPEVNGTIAPTTVYVRLNGAAPQDPALGVVSFLSQNAITPTVNLEGVILECAVTATTTVSGVTITANAAGLSYVWIDCGNGNAVIPGQTGQSFTATENGSYAVIVTDGPCSATSDCVAITTIGLESEVKTTLKLYPNPAGNFVTIDGVVMDSFITIYDAMGRIVNTSIATSTLVTLDCSVWERGVYTVVVKSTLSETTLKLVK